MRGLNGVQLAFVGDTIYDLYARTQVLEEHDESVRQLHRRAVARVNAAAQARAFAALFLQSDFAAHGFLPRSQAVGNWR